MALFRNEQSQEKTIGQMQIELTQIVMNQIEGQIETKFKHVADIIDRDISGQIELAVKKQLDGKIDSIFDKAFTDIIRGKMMTEMSDYVNQITMKVDHYFEVLKGYKSFLMVDQFKRQMSLIQGEVNGAVRMAKEAIVKVDKMQYNVPDHLLNDFTNEQIRKAFLDSGAKLSDVASRFNVSAQSASNYINGKVKNKNDRQLLHQFLTTFKSTKEEIAANA